LMTWQDLGGASFISSKEIWTVVPSIQLIN